MAAPRNNADLIARAQSGDGVAIELLLADCQGDLRRYAKRHCAVSEIDDAVQEALLIVSRHMKSLRSATSFAGWLFTIVRRECNRLSRRMFPYEALDEAAVETALAARSDADLRLELAAAIESLPSHYREIVLLRDFEELTMSELCARLGLSTPNAKSRLRRARALVREYLLGDETPPI